MKDLPLITATVIDGGNLLHETILHHSKSMTYGTMSKDLLTKVCSSRGEKVHLVLDKFQSPSIKDTKRNLRGHFTTQPQVGRRWLRAVVFCSTARNRQRLAGDRRLSCEAAPKRINKHSCICHNWT